MEREDAQSRGLIDQIYYTTGRVLVSLLVPVVTFLVMWRGFIFLRDGDAPKAVTALVAIIWGVGGVAILYLLSNWLVEQFPQTWTDALRPFVFVGPALAILSWYLLIPTIRTLYLSFLSAQSERFVGLDNYIFAFTNREMVISFRNNLLWLIIGTGFSVGFGLLVAILADRSKFETVAKSLIFLPYAISFVGAGVIWRFIYFYKPPSQEQIGLLNAILVGLGGEPRAWLTLRPWNNFFLIIITVWLQTGYAMVLLSAALKGVPEELLEAGRIDGATETQAFFRIIIPYIQGTIVTVSTTVIIFTLKIFDIVFVMTNGNFGTEVIASRFYKQMFQFQHFGRGGAIAIILLIAVIPVMWYNLRQFGEQEAF
ncbi:MAG: sugar ABC transporter permease [Anaerolineae bacterium]|nr:sugar ABC transporter permease [Anaerolineae bacterium]